MYTKENNENFFKVQWLYIFIQLQIFKMVTPGTRDRNTNKCQTSVSLDDAMILSGN